MQETIGFFRFPRKNGFLPSFRGFGFEQNAFFTLQVYHLSSPTGSSIHWVSSTDLDHLWIPFRKKSRHRNTKPTHRDFFYTYKTNGGNRCPWQKKCHNKSWFVEKCHSNVWGLLVVPDTKPLAFLNPLVFPGLRCFGPYSASKTDPSNLAPAPNWLD